VLTLIGELARILGVFLNRDNIKKQALEEYESQKKQLKSKLSNKFVYLKMDACTHHHLSYFAINVSCVDEGKNYTKTVVIRDTQAKTFQQVLNTLGRRCVARLWHSERPCITHCHR